MELFDTQANATVASIDTVPQDFRFMYKAGENGQHILDAENPVVKSALNVYGSMKGALVKARGDLKTAKSTTVDLSALSEYGADPAAIAAKFKEKVEGLEASIKTVNVAQIKEGIVKEWSPKVEAAVTRATALEAQLYDVLVVNDATMALTEAKGEIELLMPFVKQQVKQVRADDGKVYAHVVDAKGETRYNGAGAPMTVRELITEMKGNPKFGKLFASEAPKGGGARPGGSNQQQQKKAGGDDLSSTQRIAAGLAALRKG